MDYRGFIAGIDGTKYTIRLYDEALVNYTEIEIAGVSIEEDSDEDIFKPVRTWNGTISIYDNGNYDLSVLIPNDYNAIKFEMYNTSTNEMVWKGFVRPETYSQDYTGEGTTVEVQVCSPIASAEVIELDNTLQGYDTLANIIRECLLTAGYDDTDSIRMAHIFNDTDLSGGTGIEVLGYEYNRFAFFQESGMTFDEPNYKPYITDGIYTVLGKIMQFFGLTLHEKGTGVSITHPNATGYVEGLISALQSVSYDTTGWATGTYPTKDIDSTQEYRTTDQYSDIDKGRKYVQISDNLHLLDDNIFEDIDLQDFDPWCECEELLGAYVPDTINAVQAYCRHFRLRAPSNSRGLSTGHLYKFIGTASSYYDTAFANAANWAEAQMSDFTLADKRLITYPRGSHVPTGCNTITGATFGQVAQPFSLIDYDGTPQGRHYRLNELDWQDCVIIFPSQRTDGYGAISPNLPVLTMKSKGTIPQAVGALFITGKVGITHRHCDNLYDYYDPDHLWADTFLAPYGKPVNRFGATEVHTTDEMHIRMYVEVKVGNKYFHSGRSGTFSWQRDDQYNTYARIPFSTNHTWSTVPIKEEVFLASRPSEATTERSMIGDTRTTRNPYSNIEGFIMNTNGAVSGEVEVNFYILNNTAEMVYIKDLKLEFRQPDTSWDAYRAGRKDRNARNYYRQTQIGSTGAPYLVNLDVVSYDADAVGSMAALRRGSGFVSNLLCNVTGTHASYTPEKVLLNVLHKYYDNPLYLRTLTFTDTPNNLQVGDILTLDNETWFVLSRSVSYADGTVAYKICKQRAITSIV